MGNLRMIKGTSPPQIGVADYVWFDSLGNPHFRLRPIEVFDGGDQGLVPRIEHWVGRSSAGAASVILHPAHYLPDPFRPQPCYIVLCEAKSLTDQPLELNTRADLRDFVSHSFDVNLGNQISFEIAYRPQPDKSGFQMAEKFVGACVDAGLLIQGATYDKDSLVWSVRVGARGFSEDPTDPTELLVTICDHTRLALAFLDKAAREYGVAVKLALGSAFVQPGTLGDEVLIKGLRQYWDVSKDPAGVQVELKRQFDPYKTAVQLLTDVQALEDNK